ncbi:chromosome segregation ATPase family protein [Histoplasma capsulatum var. duboisii H88]|uniref:Chromosome segregation ATPase family protein n=1 Tax=Ajellomyces capsulatus (strain H88) TaxID=544711 RepID=A0A8A1L9K4_AJEC8|nr:chromosome segregation ATPase family protein [Histoplasma capsulatum var. duboisii H88]
MLVFSTARNHLNRLPPQHVHLPRNLPQYQKAVYIFPFGRTGPAIDGNHQTYLRATPNHFLDD